MTDILTQHAPRYIVMDAPGCYGDFAKVYSSHATLDEARKARRRNKRLIVSTDGGWQATHQPGSVIHREFAARYQRLD